MVVTVRIISNVSSHSNISVGAVTFRNTGKPTPVNSELVPGRGLVRRLLKTTKKKCALYKLKISESKFKPSDARHG